jgi:acyl carrier protein
VEGPTRSDPSEELLFGDKMSESIRKVSFCICETLGLDDGELSASDLLRDLRGWDSVVALRALARIEREFGARLPLKSYVMASTVEDVAELASRVVSDDQK